MAYILAIESSCDETSAAVLQDSTILSNIVSSQINVHKHYGGVVPEVASRLHTECIHHVINKACTEASITLQDLSSIAVTMGPGLEGCLLVGISVAKTLSLLLDIPLIPVNHLHGHIFAHKHRRQTLSYPCIALLVSGGHTELIFMSNPSSFEKIGKTRDDAAGEVFDKVARYLGLGYPGGPIIEKHARTGDSTAFSFPIPMKNTPLEFSFSGLKTAVIDCIDSLEHPADHIDDICASFQKAVITTLLFKSLEACELKKASHLIISGGVTANQALQSAFSSECPKNNITLIQTDKALCTDNAAMIGLASVHLDNYYSLSLENIVAKSRLSV
ncbi:tRNA (adenosine(37)-N6)-threonylcarbamoyltransferase complex transferase subunit TsaD [Candidatus Marinamargulisbacteria bacterium SCGC AG-343-D04]|nr:tRNA (adenosine(37)-N6)-threonylcarbamoyltransferase complex transferase subunit TsaD [Candidatus Marinamargulisbacteria bacterium SCGC AG-343-D04]